MDTTIRTARGTLIKRYQPTGVGKWVGNHLYLHEDYALHAIAILRGRSAVLGARLEGALAVKVREFPQFEFRCLRLDLTHGSIRFDEAPDFDTAREPHVGKWLEVCPSGRASRGHSNAIWHHKFLWVKDDYRGFDVAEARRWSATYSPLIAGVPKASVRTFEAQLKAAGLQ